MIRILLITESLIKGGKERRLVELIKGLSFQNEIDCKLLILKDIMQYPEIERYNIPVLRLKRRKKKDIGLFFSLFSICMLYKPHIIHSWGSMPSIYCLPCVILLRIKFINAMISNAICKIGSKNHIRSLITFPFSNVIISNSVAGLKAYHVSSKKGIVIYNGFDPKRIHNIIQPRTIKNLLKINADYIVGMVGAFHKRKDYDTFIKAAIYIVNRIKNVIFLAIGDGIFLDQIKTQVPEIFKERIIFTGLVHEIESYINIMDIGVLLTNPHVHAEGISNSILEYMALSKPVIATKGGGTPEIVTDGETGFLIDPFDVQSLVEKIEFLISNPEICKEMGAKGYQKISQEFSLSSMVDKTIRLYHSLSIQSN